MGANDHGGAAERGQQQQDVVFFLSFFGKKFFQADLAEKGNDEGGEQDKSLEIAAEAVDKEKVADGMGAGGPDIQDG